MYVSLKTLHLLGVVILLGNVTITAFWKVLSDWTRDPAIIAHSQRGVTIADWIFTTTGIFLTLIGGYGAAYIGEFPLLGSSWLFWGQALFAVSGFIWLGILIPIQIRQSSCARQFATGGKVPQSYWKDARSWLQWGIIATVPLIAAIYVMVAKPS